MDFLSSIEGRIDALFRKIFSVGKSGDGVQPVQIAKETVKAMESMRQVSVETVYVPNYFEVRLHPVDHGMIAPVRNTVVRDCIAYAVRTAERRGFSFAGAVEIELVPDESVHRGELRVVAAFREQNPGEPSVGVETTRYAVQSQGFAAAASLARGSVEHGTRRYPAVGEKLAPSGAFIEVAGGEGGLVLVPGRSYTIGRSDENDLRLNDARVSRRHARFVYENGSWWVEDLQTTNGTRKNGIPLRRERLQDGDEVSVGLSVLRFTERAKRG